MIAYINQNINYLIELAFKEDATAIELIYISCGFAVLWGIVFTTARPILSYFTYGKPWLYAACEYVMFDYFVCMFVVIYEYYDILYYMISYILTFS